MRSRTHGIGRRIAAGSGALALALGAAACTGGDQEPPQSPSTSTSPQDAPGQETTEQGAAAPSDGGGEETGSPFSDEQLESASQRFVEGLQLLDDQDWDSACRLVLDPTTHAAPEGARLQDCVDGVERALASYSELLVPGRFDVIDASMVRASDNGDGTVSLSLLEEPVDIPMVQGDDQEWYFSIPF
ncbi:hypothetical protein GCM10023160_22610 [Brachybacterium paraconglomeratum]|uniref:hypothetical protein n=1 Tax=Brachybacterium paraconglomeratum TaxID=173362 RepID=UPI0031E71204